MHFNGKFWLDPFVLNALTPTQALLYNFLITGFPEHLTGIQPNLTADSIYWSFRPRDVNRSEIETTLAVLQDNAKVVYDPPELWLVNYFRYRESLRPDLTQRHVARVLGSVRSRAIYDGFVAKYVGHRYMPDPVPEYRLLLSNPFAWTPPETAQARAALSKIKPDPPPEPPPPELPGIVSEVQAVWDAYVQIMNAKAMTLTTPRRDKIVKRLSDKVADPETGEIRSVTPADLIAAIVACRKSGFHMGKNDRDTKYNVLEKNILASTEQLQGWLKKAWEGNPSSTNDAWAGQESGEVDLRAARRKA